ncbi:MAG: outer membrane lipid asymmetry maintenance protein MlaD [Gammaproteobacteria bacterium CG_4_10_14_0_8_um_filter_38_16]|nr:MAG: outer membrane lipid asymmetry maintenance protein MlaD [Gammaproteobacteria bacterium CG_4_10_14_0_8_um_filter_38_16]PJA04182.1 MAG: outer membrane lipid asymmetry maintenance protein MlaD [Gammaproteobacteria bacterium CG_4_10_14_0_2_um_filter_38_22]PJB10361.1 MAG: outer membrane lipid asymmetry maintenance protein MlaD [Gammaproteobacteria bacterium CG_4_9_14_3_um_filter_38_9]
MRNHWLELGVGFFIVVALFGLLFLAFKVSGLTQIGDGNHYVLRADFDNVGDLKVRAPVSVSGVKVGRVSGIKLDPKTYRAEVILQIDKRFQDFPIDTSASILTQGLLGSNYVSLTPGFEQQMLKPDGRIETTHSALILENLIGQLMFSLTNGNNKNQKSTDNSRKKI